MINIEKDSVLQANVNGIQVILEFDGNNNIINVEEINGNALIENNINLETINYLKHNDYTEFKGEVKAVITIRKENLYKGLNKLKFGDEFVDYIITYLTTPNLRQHVTLVICGNINNIDKFDEAYNCEVCKYFSEFYKLPKIKFKENVDSTNVRFIIDHWLEKYCFDSILLNANDKIDLFQFCNMKKLNPKSLKLIKSGDKYSMYYEENSRLTSINIIYSILTFNSYLEDSSIYYFNNHFIANNIMSDVVNLVIKEHDFVDGQIIKVQGEWANERY